MLIRIIMVLLLSLIGSISVTSANLQSAADIKIISVSPLQSRGGCPQKVRVTARIKSMFPTNIHYQFIYSDGYKSQVKHTRLHGQRALLIHTNRSFDSSFNGWVRLKILSPYLKQSQKFPFRLRCRHAVPVPQTLVRRVSLDILPVNVVEQCPKKIKFKGRIELKRGGVVKYRFIQSNGKKGPVKRLNARTAGVYNVFGSWVVDRTYQGWVRLKILTPDTLITPKARFSLTCRQRHVPLIKNIKIKAIQDHMLGECPKTVRFDALIKVRRAGIIHYRFEKSDGTRTAPQRLRVRRAGTYKVTMNWRLRRDTRGWVRLRITAPEEKLSSKAYFTLRCPRRIPIPPLAEPLRISELRLEADPALPERYRRDCPSTVTFHAEFFASRAGRIRYRFIRSDGRVGETQSILSRGPGFYSVVDSWRIGRSTRGWERLEILDPVHIRSSKAHFEILCTEDPVRAEATNLKVYVDAPSRAFPGEDLTDRVRLLVRNQGNGNALGTVDGNGYQVDLILSSDRASRPEFATYSDQYHDNVLLKGGRVVRTRSLAPGASQTYLPNAVLPSKIASGDYYLCARVDPGNVVRETNERDNLSCTPLRILRPVASQNLVAEGETGGVPQDQPPVVSRNSDGDHLNDAFEMELLQRFRPYYKMSKDEQYIPSDALYQLKHAVVRKGKVAESLPSFLQPDKDTACTVSQKDPLALLSCDDHRLDLLHTMQATGYALDLDNVLRSDPGSGKAVDWDSAISFGAGLYGHVVEDEGLIKIEYWQYFPYSESNGSGFGHEGDWETLQLWYDDVQKKLVGVCHWAHGAGICFDMNKAEKLFSEKGFTYYQGADSNHTFKTITAKELESNRYPADYQNDAIIFYTKHNSMHPVVYVEKNTHAFWPTPKGRYAEGNSHDGEGHSYLTLFEEEGNLGELNATLPDAAHRNSLILRYNGLWGAEHESLSQPPLGPTQRCQWRYSESEYEKTKGLKQACVWE